MLTLNCAVSNKQPLKSLHGLTHMSNNTIFKSQQFLKWPGWLVSLFFFSYCVTVLNHLHIQYDSENVSGDASFLMQLSVY